MAPEDSSLPGWGPRWPCSALALAAFKAARRELAVVAEAEELANTIDESDVQERTYEEGRVVLRVLDGRDAPLAEPAPPSADAVARGLFPSELQRPTSYNPDVPRQSIQPGFVAGVANTAGYIIQRSATTAQGVLG